MGPWVEVLLAAARTAGRADNPGLVQEGGLVVGRGLVSRVWCDTGCQAVQHQLFRK